jgi:hypothetical protein
MEFDYKNNRIIGIVAQHRGEDNARIKVFGYKGNDNKYISFNNEEVVNYFPHEGFIFEPSFFKSKLKLFDIDDLIEFKSTLMERDKEGGDHYRIFNSDAVKIGQQIKVFKLKDIHLKIHEIDLSKAVLADCEYTGDFYGLYDNFVIGKLRSQNGKITPTLSKEVKKWSKDSCEIIEYESKICMLSEPSVGFMLLDAMDSEQLFNWFRDKLKIINQRVVKELDENTKWRTLLPELMGNSNDDIYQLDNVRLKRVESNLEKFNLRVKDFTEFTNISEKLHTLFILAIEKHKIELRSEYEEEIKILEGNKELEKQKLDQSLSKICVDIAHKKKEIASLDEEINSKNSHIEHIAANKDRILSDFLIIQEVLEGKLRINETFECKEDSFVIEKILPNATTTQFRKRDEFTSRLKYFLNQRNFNFSHGGRYLSTISSYSGIFLKDIELGIAFIEATGNSQYIIQQVEPDWLHFKDLWENGLEAIWKSSHENPEIMHFLILEDVNLSSPECYMRPLLDCINGIRKQIPFAKSAYPNNLKIFATKISSEEPKIGLPLYQQTFKNWGAIGFAEDIKNVAEQSHSFIDGYIDSKTLVSFRIDESELKSNSTRFESEFKILFD